MVRIHNVFIYAKIVHQELFTCKDALKRWGMSLGILGSVTSIVKQGYLFCITNLFKLCIRMS